MVRAGSLAIPEAESNVDAASSGSVENGAPAPKREPTGKARPGGDPAGPKAPRADRPRKASACSGNQRPNCTSNKKTVGKLDFHRVCLQSGCYTMNETPFENEVINPKR